MLIVSSLIGDGGVGGCWETDCAGAACFPFDEDETVLYVPSSARLLEFGLRGDCYSQHFAASKQDVLPVEHRRELLAASSPWGLTCDPGEGT